jgi:hypothetical protein
MRKLSSCLIALASLAAFAPVASAADMPVKAPPRVVAAPTPGGFFFSVTGGYYFDDPNRDMFIGPTAVVGGQGAGFGDGWGTRGVAGYRWAVWDIAVAFGYAKFSQGKLQASYGGAGSTLHAPRGHYWAVDGELGYNVMMNTLKVRLFAGPRFVRWTAHDQDRQVGLAFTFDSKTEAVGPRVGFAVSGPFAGNVGWMAEGAFAYLFGDITGTVGGLAPVQTLKVDRNITNGEARLGLEWNLAPASKLTVGYQAEYWNGAHPRDEYNGFGAPLLGGRAEQLHHGPFARFTYGL